MEPVTPPAQPQNGATSGVAAGGNEANEAEEFRRVLDSLATGMFSAYAEEIFKLASEEE